MSVTSGFFNSINGDRTYNAQQMSSIFDGIINDGVFANVGTAFSVQATTGNTVNVGTGRCWFDSTWLLNDATLPIELDDAEVLLDRIDAIVIEINHSESVRSGSIKVVNGTPSSTPTNPTMTHTDYINQYPIAYIMRSANSDAITQANITYTVGSNACPFITGILSVVSIQNIVAQWENEFDTWLDSLSAMLDDNTAANLANQILELKEQFDTLAKEKKIYSELEDSTGEDTINDSTGSPILGTTAMYSDDGASESIPGTATSDDPYKVGDTLTTARTDLGAKWLLCNGDVLDKDQYPELASLFPYQTYITGNWSTNIMFEKEDAYVNDQWVYGITRLEGQYLVYGYKDNSSNVQVGFISHSNELNGSFMTEELSNSGAINFDTVESLYYVGGQYIAIESGGYAYSTSINGPWIYAQNTYAESNQAFNSPKYYNGYYIVAGYDSWESSGTRAFKLKYASTLNGPWTTKVLANVEQTNPTNDSDACKIFYVNGYYVALITESGSSSLQNSFGKLAYSTSLDGSWTVVTIWTAAHADWLTDMIGIVYVNGRYVIAGRHNGTAHIYYAETLNGSWTTMNAPSNWTSIDAISNDDNNVIMVYGTSDGMGIAQMESPTSEKVTKDIWTDVEKVFPECFYYNEGSYIIGARRQTDGSTTGTCDVAIAYISPSEINLPSISLSDKTYTYIRAKE